MADIAAAIAMAESGGDSQASHVNSDGSIDRGVWQINSVHGSLSTFDPIANAKAAIQISNNGSNWSPWTTFKTGAYKKYLSPTTPAGGNVPTNATTTGLFGIPGLPSLSVSGIIEDMINTVLKMLGLGSLKDLAERAGLIILGFALLLVGIKILSSGGGTQPININTTSEESEEGTKTSRSIKTPVSHTKTTTSSKAASGTGSGEALEAAAVA